MFIQAEHSEDTLPHVSMSNSRGHWYIFISCRILSSTRHVLEGTTNIDSSLLLILDQVWAMQQKNYTTDVNIFFMRPVSSILVTWQTWLMAKVDNNSLLPLCLYPKCSQNTIEAGCNYISSTCTLISERTLNLQMVIIILLLSNVDSKSGWIILYKWMSMYITVDTSSPFSTRRRTSLYFPGSLAEEEQEMLVFPLL